MLKLLRKNALFLRTEAIEGAANNWRPAETQISEVGFPAVTKKLELVNLKTGSRLICCSRFQKENEPVIDRFGAVTANATAKIEELSDR